jgi:hypothetical protein
MTFNLKTGESTIEWFRQPGAGVPGAIRPWGPRLRRGTSR